MAKNGTSAIINKHSLQAVSLIIIAEHWVGHSETHFILLSILKVSSLNVTLSLLFSRNRAIN